MKLKAVECISLQMSAKMSSGNSTLNRVQWRARSVARPQALGGGGRYLFASDEQGRDPKQLETVCSHRRGG